MSNYHVPSKILERIDEESAKEQSKNVIILARSILGIIENIIDLSLKGSKCVGTTRVLMDGILSRKVLVIGDTLLLPAKGGVIIYARKEVELIRIDYERIRIITELINNNNTLSFYPASRRKFRRVSEEFNRVFSKKYGIFFGVTKEDTFTCSDTAFETVSENKPKKQTPFLNLTLGDFKVSSEVLNPTPKLPQFTVSITGDCIEEKTLLLNLAQFEVFHKLCLGNNKSPLEGKEYEIYEAFKKTLKDSGLQSILRILETRAEEYLSYDQIPEDKKVTTQIEKFEISTIEAVGAIPSRRFYISISKNGDIHEISLNEKQNELFIKICKANESKLYLSSQEENTYRVISRILTNNGCGELTLFLRKNILKYVPLINISGDKIVDTHIGKYYIKTQKVIKPGAYELFDISINGKGKNFTINLSSTQNSLFAKLCMENSFYELKDWEFEKYHELIKILKSAGVLDLIDIFNIKVKYKVLFDDIPQEERIDISIESVSIKSLEINRENGKKRFYVNITDSKSGTQTISLTPKENEVFKLLIQKKKNAKANNKEYYARVKKVLNTHKIYPLVNFLEEHYEYSKSIDRIDTDVKLDLNIGGFHIKTMRAFGKGIAERFCVLISGKNINHELILGIKQKRILKQILEYSGTQKKLKAVEDKIYEKIKKNLEINGLQSFIEILETKIERSENKKLGKDENIDLRIGEFEIRSLSSQGIGCVTKYNISITDEKIKKEIKLSILENEVFKKLLESVPGKTQLTGKDYRLYKKLETILRKAGLDDLISLLQEKIYDVRSIPEDMKIDRIICEYHTHTKYFLGPGSGKRLTISFSNHGITKEVHLGSNQTKVLKKLLDDEVSKIALSKKEYDIYKSLCTILQWNGLEDVVNVFSNKIESARSSYT